MKIVRALNCRDKTRKVCLSSGKPSESLLFACNGPFNLSSLAQLMS